MDKNEMVKAIRDSTEKRFELLEKLSRSVEPALAVLEDLGHKSTARPIREILFELQSIESELAETMRSNPAATVEAMRKLFERT